MWKGSWRLVLPQISCFCLFYNTASNRDNLTFTVSVIKGYAVPQDSQSPGSPTNSWGIVCLFRIPGSEWQNCFPSQWTWKCRERRGIRHFHLSTRISRRRVSMQRWHNTEHFMLWDITPCSLFYYCYTDRAAAKLSSTFADRGCHVVSVTDIYDRILGFLDRSRYFLFQVVPLIVLTKLSGPRSRPTTSQKTRTTGSVATDSDR
jgi:hypothetical protein